MATRTETAKNAVSSEIKTSMIVVMNVIKKKYGMPPRTTDIYVYPETQAGKVDAYKTFLNLMQTYVENLTDSIKENALGEEAYDYGDGIIMMGRN